MEVSNIETPQQQQVEHNAERTLHAKRISGTVPDTFEEPSTTVPITEKGHKSKITSQSIMNKSLFNSFFPIRILEKIPLIIKLALIIAFCLIPMAVFGALLINSAAVNLNHANEIKKLSRVTMHLSELGDCLQNERGITSLYLGSHKRQYTIELAEARNRTDNAIERFFALSVSPNDILINEQWKRTWYLFEDYLGKVIGYSKGVGEWRMKVENVTNETFLPTIQYINDWDSLINDMIRVVTSQSLDPTFAIIHNSFNLLSAAREYRGIRRIYGTFGFMNGSLSQASIDSFKEAVIKGILVRHLFSLQASNEIYTEFLTNILNDTQQNICQSMEDYVLDNYQNLTKYTLEEWFFNMTLCMNSFRDCGRSNEIGLIRLFESNWFECYRFINCIYHCYSNCGSCGSIGGVAIFENYSRTLEENVASPRGYGLQIRATRIHVHYQ
ncbi:predicted protein [Naegleria gruberi]|uniref:Predicted protein n=1 Tax=Naegleria gruberi TaxID=5762 RepID=D2VZM3_NAEGR|nr:uncharacterized protein NAEGRDRAFT_74539 [Naegleria gruberi]EFC37723.1 predicted protein [Naegleria gruberi]|eukprot:XP_002670467.1 predicted protein [Naegleria gruberi strain NEG-M]